MQCVSRKSRDSLNGCVSMSLGWAVSSSGAVIWPMGAVCRRLWPEESRNGTSHLALREVPVLGAAVDSPDPARGSGLVDLANRTREGVYASALSGTVTASPVLP